MAQRYPKLDAGGKPFTWLPSRVCVEQQASQVNNDLARDDDDANAKGKANADAKASAKGKAKANDDDGEHSNKYNGNAINNSTVTGVAPAAAIAAA